MNESFKLSSSQHPELDAPMALLDAIFDSSNLLNAHMDINFNFIRVSKAYAEINQKKSIFF
ncbi:MAG: hypothetical protein ACFE8P_02405 [Promethearchaeota archaeon]